MPVEPQQPPHEREPAQAATARPPGLHDVAKAAGVSHQTVSRVLNGHPSIRESTRLRVQNAIDALNYRPNRLARALKSNRSKLIGVLSASSSLYGPSSSIRAIEVAARRAGYFVITVNVDSADALEVARGLDSLLDHAVEGLVVIAPEQRVLEAFTALRVAVPIVTLQSTADSRDSELSVDQVAGARLAVRHLIELGHTAIAHVSGPPDWFWAEARAEGYRAELNAAALEVAEPFAGDWSAQSGFASGLRMLEQRRFTAVFCANDQMALGVMRAADQLGVRVGGLPRNSARAHRADPVPRIGRPGLLGEPDPTLSVIGFDDMPEAAYFHPPLTTMRQDFDELGRRSVELLLRKVDATASGGREDPVGEYRDSMVPELIIRRSTAAAS